MRETGQKKLYGRVCNRLSGRNIYSKDSEAEEQVAQTGCAISIVDGVSRPKQIKP